MRRENILVLANGPWQAVAAVAALKKLNIDSNNARVICLLVDMEPQSMFFRATQDIFYKHGYESSYFVPKKITARKLSHHAAQIEKSFVLDFSTVSHILTFGYHRPVGRFFCNLAANAKIKIYEEGLRTYIAPHGHIGSKILRKLGDVRAMFDRPFHHMRYDAQFLNRDREFCLVLGDQIDLPAECSDSSVHPIADSEMRDVLNIAGLQAIKHRGDKGLFLIVGQYYAQLNQMSVEQEIELYTEAANQIVRMGFTPVWRGHIREEDHLRELLQTRCPELRDFSEFVDDPSYPLEFYADFFEQLCVGIASLSSSSLFYLKYLYRVPAYTLMNDHLSNAMTYPHNRAWSLVKQSVSSFGHLTPAIHSV